MALCACGEGEDPGVHPRPSAQPRDLALAALQRLLRSHPAARQHQSSAAEKSGAEKLQDNVARGNLPPSPPAHLHVSQLLLSRQQLLPL